MWLVGQELLDPEMLSYPCKGSPTLLLVGLDGVFFGTWGPPNGGATKPKLSFPFTIVELTIVVLITIPLLTVIVPVIAASATTIVVILSIFPLHPVRQGLSQPSP